MYYDESRYNSLVDDRTEVCYIRNRIIEKVKVVDRMIN